MQRAQIPTKFPIPFANDAVAPYKRQVPTDSQIGIQAGAASLTDGFPPDTFIAVSAGGTPPFGEDANGILFQATSWDRWFSAGGPIYWDSTFSAAIGGYPEGAIVRGLIPASQWVSTADNNLTNPDDPTTSVGWSPIGPSTGDGKPTLKTVADYGWIFANDGTVGNASSNATTYANAFAEALFTLIWSGVTNTFAPLYTSGGILVARGATPALDFAANRAIKLPLALGRALCVAGAGATLTNRALGENLGEQTHVLTIPEMPAHTHTPNNGSGVMTAGGTDQGFFASGPKGSAGLANTGGDGAHNNMQPSTFVNYMIKL